MTMMQIIAAIVMVAVALLLFFGFRRYLAANSERRMRAMLVSVGLDPELADSEEIPTIMKEVRERCRQCSSESVCERWLDGEVPGDNAFCPNHRVFRILAKYTEGDQSTG